MMDDMQEDTGETMRSYVQLISVLNKKRWILLRKPNFEDMIDRFNTLMDLFHTNGNLRYAAFCCLAVARCEKALQDINGEAMGYTNCGHEFYLAEIERSAANEPCFEEYVGEATQCYLTAISLYLRKDTPSKDKEKDKDKDKDGSASASVPATSQQNPVPPSVAFNAPNSVWTATAGSLYHELATLLQRLGRCGEACTYFLKAAEIHQGLDQYRTTLASLWAAVDASITQCDYITTCVTLNWIVKIAYEMPDMTDALKASLSGSQIKPLQSTMKKDEVKDALLTLVLVLILQGDYQQSKDYIQKLTESCAQASVTETDLGTSARNTGDAILLQTASEFSSLLSDFVTACETSDVTGMKWCQKELWPFLQARQNELVHRIVVLKVA